MSKKVKRRPRAATARVLLRITGDERRTYQQAAYDVGLTVNEWIRQACERSIGDPTLASRVSNLEYRVEYAARLLANHLASTRKP